MSLRQRRRRRLISPTWQKRAEFVALSFVMGGDIHYERWPERSTFGRTRFDGPQKRKR